MAAGLARGFNVGHCVWVIVIVIFVVGLLCLLICCYISIPFAHSFGRNGGTPGAEYRLLSSDEAFIIAGVFEGLQGCKKARR
jgi:phage shock protein PspC (stress-responsive transcriptional regulator)